MKRILLAGATLLALTAAQPTLAADAPVYRKGPAPAAAALFSWTGFYVGAHVGHAWSDVAWSFTANTPSDHRGTSWFGGGQIGYNFQAGAIVFGVEVDGSWANIRGDAACPNPAFRCGSDIHALYSARGRLGFTPWPQALIYGTAGWSWASVTYDAIPVTPGGFTNGPITIDGFVYGVGIEWAYNLWGAQSPYWSWKLEYLAYDFGNEVHSAAPLGTMSAHPKVQTVKLGVNLRF